MKLYIIVYFPYFILTVKYEISIFVIKSKIFVFKLLCAFIKLNIYHKSDYWEDIPFKIGNRVSQKVHFNINDKTFDGPYSYCHS